MKLHFLPTNTFRVGRQYELVESNRMAQSAPPALAVLFSDPDVYGLFVPVDTQSMLSPKIAYKDVALLYYSLQTEGRLPRFMLNAYDDETNTTLARLVLDGILEVCYNGRFVSGAAAQAALYRDNAAMPAPAGRLSAISEKAIRYALYLYELDPRSIAQRLYGFNTMPAGPSDYADLTDSAAVDKFLRVATLSRKGLLNGWKKQSPADKFGWIAWHRQQNAHAASYKRQPTYKIYISPAIDALPAVFQQFVQVLPVIEAFSFKVGANREGLLRPDKLVVYFRSYSSLQQAAEALKAGLHCEQVQGVPFTCPIDEAGLLSWGIDPPSAEVIKDLEGGSWRAEITDKIAVAVSQSHAEHIHKGDAVHFILNKISLLGVDTANWMPLNYLTSQN